jgi:hypothetical protein
MLESDQHGVVVGPDHEWIHFGVWGRAGPLATQVKKYRSTLLAKKLAVYPISL